jgi:hypothetical protein
MEVLSLNQTLRIADTPRAAARTKPKSKFRYTFSATRWLVGASALALAIWSVTQLSAAQDLVSALHLEIEQLQQLLQDPNRWLH